MTGWDSPWSGPLDHCGSAQDRASRASISFRHDGWRNLWEATLCTWILRLIADDLKHSSTWLPDWKGSRCLWLFHHFLRPGQWLTIYTYMYDRPFKLRTVFFSCCDHDLETLGHTQCMHSIQLPSLTRFSLLRTRLHTEAPIRVVKNGARPGSNSAINSNFHLTTLDLQQFMSKLLQKKIRPTNPYEV